MSLLEHAKRELQILSDRAEGDEMQEEINRQILEIVEVFSKQGHSGMTASYAISHLERLLNFQPITPLRGTDDEWNDVTYGDERILEQNNRNPEVFREDKDNSKAYTIRGKIFSDDGGRTFFTNQKSHVPIEFPYMPKEPRKFLVKDCCDKNDCKKCNGDSFIIVKELEA